MLVFNQNCRTDMWWTRNTLARAVTKVDQTLARLISYIHFTKDHRQVCHVGDQAHFLRLGLFQDASFAGDLQDSNSPGSVLCFTFW